MKILNLREGFACNSSSTHSIVFTTPCPEDYDTDGGFNWNFFVAASQEAKMSWLGASLAACLGDVGEETVKVVVESLTGSYDPENVGVDHQSQISFPKSWSRAGLDMAFATEFCAYLSNPAAVVLGGNDNASEGDGHRVSGNHVNYRSILPVECSRDVVARKDSAGYWTIFNRSNGDKSRVSFSDESMEVVALRADAPELVDMKITDYCTYDCPTCYQGSTRDGKHAKYYTVLATLKALAAARCFEIAFGGGEPTLHPEFSEIIEETKRLGMVPNFTTRDPKWFVRHPEAIEHVGAYAVSCDSAADVRKAKAAVEALPEKERSILSDKLTVQHILGSVSEYDLGEVLRACHNTDVPLVLLGYKTTHRGASATPHIPRDGKTWGAWLYARLTDEKYQDGMPYRLGVDTVLAGELAVYPDLEYRLTTKEGQFSGYIDTVGEKPKMYASSFSLDEGRPFDHYNPEELLQAWRTITSYAPESAYVYKRHLV